MVVVFCLYRIRIDQLADELSQGVMFRAFRCARNVPRSISEDLPPDA